MSAPAKRGFTSFLEMNRRCSAWTARRITRTREHAHDRYVRAISALLAEPQPQLILDIGTGRKSDYSEALKSGHCLIGLDYSLNELRENPHIHFGAAADAEAMLPFADASFDLVTCCRLVEHLRRPEGLLAEAHRLLKPGGYFVLFFPLRFAAFALVKRVLPHALSTKLIRAMHWPASRDFCWSKLYYRRCTARQMTSSLRGCGFEIQSVQADFNSAEHFAPIYPAYLFVLLVEQLLHYSHCTALASYVTITAKKIST